MSLTEKLLNELNQLGGKHYPDVGYYFFADVKGDGQNRKSVYVITNENGGVTYSSMNGATPKERCDNIRTAIKTRKAETCSKLKK